MKVNKQATVKVLEMWELTKQMVKLFTILNFKKLSILYHFDQLFSHASQSTDDCGLKISDVSSRMKSFGAMIKYRL
jgi:hypothetical protein